MRKAFASLMLEVAEADDSLVVMVGDISHGILQPLAARFPERYYNIGICEPTIVNMASGLSKTGLTPVVHTIAPFIIERSFEQLKLDFEYEQQSVNLVSVGSGFDYSKLGCTHHCYDDIALLRQLPSSTIFVPGTSEEFRSQFLSSYRNEGIKYYRLSEQSNTSASLASGGTHLVRSGEDVTIVALGTRLNAALEAAQRLESSVSCEVFLVNRIKPLDDAEIRESVRRTGTLVTVEEHSVVGGLADSLYQSLAGSRYVNQALGVREFLHTYGTHEDLCVRAGVSADDIVAAARLLTEG